MFKKLFLGIVALLILGAIGATVYLNMIDWNQHKAIIAKQFSEATGKEVDFKGAVNFTLFPSPSLEASDINVYNRNNEGQQVTLAKIQKMVASLSISSLIGGKINVEKMTIINPEFFIEQYDNGRINWQSNHNGTQNFALTNIEVSLNSVMLENAKIYIANKTHDFATTITDINAEVIAGSLFGPYRIEGSYIKDGTAGGFALDLGQFSDSFATSVNIVISHPQSESYARFDGTVLLNNDAINGNIIIESKNPINFVNSLFKKVNISEDYEHPLAMSLAIKSDKKQIALSNVVIKYAESAGAGNILIPRYATKIGDSEDERKCIDVAFNMAEFNPKPAIQMLNDFWNKYDGKDYIPEIGFDIIADFKSVKTTYNDQIIRDLDISADFINNVLSIQSFTAQLPFDGNIKIKGELYSVEKVMTYNFDIEANTAEFAKTAQWLGYDLQPLSKNVYKRSSTKFNLAGTPKTIKIAPFVFNIDKTGVNGKFAMVRGNNNKYFIIAETDSLNFDNYIADMPEEIAQSDLETQAAYRFKQLSGLQNLDLQFRFSLNSGIWNKIPFEKLATEGTLKNGILKIADLSAKEIASAQIALRGDISGFGSSPQVKNLKYGINIRDNTAFTEKFGITLPNINFNNLSQFKSQGIVTGGLSRMAVKTTSKLGHIDNTYNGQISKNDGIYTFNGQLELKSNDTVRTLNDFSVDYRPNYPLGLLNLSSDINGTINAFVLKNMKANIGSNSFNGELLYSKQEDTHLIKANLNVNKFELERFFYNPSARNDQPAFRSQNEKVAFLAQPNLSKTKINYDWSKNFEIEASINADNISLNNTSVQQASWLMTLKKQVFKVLQFSAQKADGIISGNWELNIPDHNKLSGKINFKDIKLTKNQWIGTTYGIRDGIISAEVDFNTSASSIDEILTSLSGKGTFNIDKATIKGWNINAIENDLEKRSNSEGLRALIQQNLGQGDSYFNKISGSFSADNGNYRINNTIFDNDTYFVDMGAEGNFANWTINSLNRVEFKSIPDIADFNFTLEGSLSAPSLETDVSALSEVYASRIAKKEAAAKAAKDAKTAKYRSLMDEQQERAQKSYDYLQNTIIPTFNTISSKTENNDIKQSYRNINKTIAQSNNNIRDILNKNNMIDIDDDVIASLKKQNDQVDELLKRIKQEMDVTQSQDVKLRINSYYNELVKNSEELPALSSATIEISGKYGERLAAINTQYRIENDDKIADIQAEIDSRLEEINAINQQIAQDNILTKNITNTKTLETHADNFNAARKNVAAKIGDIRKFIKAYQEHLDTIVTAEEKAYYQKLQDEALQQKLNENTGKIVTAGGRNVTVERNIEDIKRSEEAIKLQNSPVINFSDSDATLLIKVENGENIESGGRILK